MLGVSAEAPCRAGGEDPLEHGQDAEQQISRGMQQSLGCLLTFPPQQV